MSKEMTWPQASHTLKLIEQQGPSSEHIKQLHDGLLTDLLKGIMAGTLPSREEIQKCYGIYGGTTHLKLISGEETLILDPTDGNETITKAEDLFPRGIDKGFNIRGCDIKNESTTEQEVVVHEMIKDGDLRTIFDSLAGNLDKLCLTQPQIIGFVRKYPHWLNPGFSNFFLLKVDDKLFVVKILKGYDGLGAYLSDLMNDDMVWACVRRYRVVTPQLLK